MWRLAAAGAVAFIAGCGAADGPHQISRSGEGAFEASLASTDQGFVAAWYDVRDGNAEIYFRLLGPDGRPVQRERRLTTDPALSYEADVQAIGMNVAVAWYDKTEDGRLRARIGLWSRDGSPLWLHALSDPDRNSRNPVLAVHAGEIFVAWLEDSGTDGSDVWASRLNLAGEPVSAPVHVAPAGRTTWNLNADVDASGRVWIAFDARAGTKSEELFLSRVDRDGVTTMQITADDGHASKYPDLALSGERAALTWYDERDGNQEIYLAVVQMTPLVGGAFARAGTQLDSIARRVTETPGHSIGAYVAWQGDTVGLAWCDDSEGDQHEIYFQPFGADGAPAGEAQRVTTNATSSLVPAIRPARDGFALAWNEYAPVSPEAGHGSTGQSEIASTVVR